MKKIVLGTRFALSAALLAAPAALAAADAPNAHAKAKYDAMTPERQAAAENHHADRSTTKPGGTATTPTAAAPVK